MATDQDRQIKNVIVCPVCDGTGKVKETYAYRTQHKYDAGGQVIQHSEVCWLCHGENGGLITPEQFDAWEKLEASPVCPLCNGTGGKRYWAWEETNQGTQKEFTYIPCRLCEGKRHVTQEQVFAHEREKQQLRFWGIGCAALVMVVGVVGATQLLTRLLNGTPLLSCCPAPGLFPVGIVLLQISKQVINGL